MFRRKIRNTNSTIKNRQETHKLDSPNMDVNTDVKGTTTRVIFFMRIRHGQISSNVLLANVKAPIEDGRGPSRI